MNDTPRTARNPATRSRLDVWLSHHAQMFLFSFGKLARAPVASLMTIAVIGISIALPAALYLLLANAQSASAGWDSNARISLYLHSVSEAGVERLRAEVAAHDGVEQVEYIDPDAALEEFRTLSGFGDALAALTENPLPAVLIVSPRVDLDALQLTLLAERLQALEPVETAELDVQWVRRLHAVLDIVQRSVFVLAALLSLAVLLAVGNTIRLDIHNRREEIEVTKLIGASNGFIRRPFLYGGLWYGLLGGVLALILTATVLVLLDGPVAQLAELYGSGFRLRGLDLRLTALVVGGSGLLGWLGSWLAVGRHLKRIEPR